MTKQTGLWAVLLVLIALLTPALTAPRAAAQTDEEFVVVYADGVSLASARAAVRAAGGTIVKENADVGVATVQTSNPSFAAAADRQAALLGVAHNVSIGQAPAVSRNQRAREEVEQLSAERAAAQGTQQGASSKHTPLAAEPLAPLQWDMQLIHATVDGSYAVQRGSRGVKVGIIDTGVDGTHPDIAPNFDTAASRNFVTDIPDIDGPCEYPSCKDPVDEDDDGHGTHVASTIGSPINGLGIAGVAPNVTLVNIRAGQDSGYFFLQPTVDALTYAGNAGIDVVNMSFYIDPWLYNCASNPADSPEAQQEQQAIIAATQRALNYAYRHGVTLIAAEGNGHTDLGNPTTDASSPDYPADAAYLRTVDNSCLTMPTEGRNVIGVTSVGPSTRKAYYSDYGVEQADLAAPGGDYRDFFGTATYRTVGNLILAAYPQALAEANGDLNPDGTPNTPFVVEDCQKGVCAYYQYLQGTSMAAPHAVGVAALIVSEFGDREGRGSKGLTLNPRVTERILKRSATDTACPAASPFVYPGLSTIYTATCVGTPAFNGFYGEGIVDALRAVRYEDR